MRIAYTMPTITREVFDKYVFENGKLILPRLLITEPYLVNYSFFSSSFTVHTRNCK